MPQLATLASLQHGHARTVEIGDTRIMLVRSATGVHAFGADCPHAGAPLAEGAICDNRIVCPWHKAEFDLHTGAVLQPPALHGLVRYPVRIADGMVLVEAEPIAPAPPALPDGDARIMLIAGAGAAGTAAACALREFGFSGRVVLLGAEAGDPYDRTALSKFVLQGVMPPDQVPPLREPAFYDAWRIERLHGEMLRLDCATHSVLLADGGSLAYDRILLATGGIPRRPRVPGAAHAHVHTLRTREDTRAIIARIGQGKPRVVILGSGFIGLEAASALREQGLPVSIVAEQQIPFATQFGERLGTMFRRLHERHGVRFLGGRRVTRIEPGQVLLDDETRLDADLVLAGLGIEPATAFAASLDRTADGGIVVDAAMRAAPDVFAAGDIARFVLPGRTQLRVEHWRVAQQQGRVAAAGMLGRTARLEPVPFFWTYHYGKRYEYLGHPEGFDAVHIDGDPEAGDFLARLRQNGETVGIVACGREAETARLLGAMTAP